MALIILDFDGVLADTLEDLLRFGQVACDRLGVDHRVTEADLNNLEVMSFATYGQACGVPDHLVEAFVKICLTLFAEKQSPPAIFPGLEDVLRHLAVDHKLVVVTTNTSKNVHAFLARHNLEGLVRAVHGVDTAGSKAEKICKARDQLLEHGSREPVYMVGDSLSDIHAAREAAVTSIAVTWGHQSRERLLGGSPDIMVDSPQELVEVIERGWDQAASPGE